MYFNVVLSVWIWTMLSALHFSSVRKCNRSREVKTTSLSTFLSDVNERDFPWVMLSFIDLLHLFTVTTDIDDSYLPSRSSIMQQRISSFVIEPLLFSVMHSMSSSLKRNRLTEDDKHAIVTVTLGNNGAVQTRLAQATNTQTPVPYGLLNIKDCVALNTAWFHKSDDSWTLATRKRSFAPSRRSTV